MKHLIPRDDEWDIYRTNNDGVMVFVDTVLDKDVDYLIDKWRSYDIQFTLHVDRGVLDD